ncbi:hypothetical protein ACE193_00125 [Bernardetia sp. OM2101]|uniref:hypothetical protein n=1 Tax=Bernardetia sp. OM2101 TaxID=3344876 RepID=UPI0035CEFAAE
MFPVLELTDWIFDSEKVLDIEFKWDGIHYIKEKDFEKQHKRVLIDCNGKVLKVTGNKILRKKGTLLSFIIPPTLVVEFNLELTGRTMTLEEVKTKILSRSAENFHITYNKLMTKNDYNQQIKSAETFETLFNIAAFVEE